MAAEVRTYDNVGMSAINRCDRCPAQAFVDVELRAGGRLLFCAHHGTEAMPKLLTLDAVITDHRPFLEAEVENARKRLGTPA